MGKLRLFPVAFLTVLLVALTACSGTGPSLDQSLGDQVDPSFAGIPPIPYDTGEAPRESSVEGDGEIVVYGKDWWQWMLNGEESGYALILEAPAEGEGDPAMAYAMYRVTDLAGKRPTSLNVECVPRGLGEEYFLGLANYTEGTWEWFGPVSVPEYSFDLSDSYDRFITELGNLYFILVCYAGNGATHYQTTVLFEDSGGGELPGAPRELWASDGTYAEKVRLEWIVGAGAAYYEVWRRADCDESEWGLLAECEANEYNDFEVEPGQVYLYKVRSVNDAGMSAFSHVDSGYAQGGGEPGCVIEGIVRHGEEGGWAGVTVYLLGRPEVLQTETNEEGGFRFGELPCGLYIVVPYHHELDFNPWHIAVELSGEECVATVEFCGYPTENLHHIRGYCYNFHEAEGFWPMSGTFVECQLHEGEQSWETETNELGYFSFAELPLGVFLVTPSKESEGGQWVFEPALHDAVVNGETLPGILFFRGSLSDEGDPPSAPYDLVASDGEFEGYVLLTWEGSEAAQWFRIKRQRVHPESEWGVIGESEAREYVDDNVDAGIVYNYAVQAVNQYGHSEWSNIDSGYAAEGGAEECYIRGYIRNGAEQPLNDIKVTLLGPLEPLVTYTDGEEGGYYAFEGLPHGRYIVVPFDQAWDFDPVYSPVDLRYETGYANVNFVGSGAECFWRLWGFVYAFDGEGFNGFRPLGGTGVQIRKDGSEDSWMVEANEDGYFLKTELPVGWFIVTPGREGYAFWPAHREAHITGEVKVEPLNFEGETSGE